MEQINFNLKQRETFAKLLAQAKDRVQSEFESDYSANSRIETQVATKFAEEYGATELIAKMRKLDKEQGELDSALQKLGFSYDNDCISLHDDAPEALNEAVEAAKRAAREERSKVLKKYDRAILGVWAADSAQDAKQIVEGLL